jgi:hypothetical protein
MSTPPPVYATPAAQQKVQGPAIALLVVAGLGGVGQVVGLLMNLLGATANLAGLPRGGAPGEELVGLLGGGLGVVLNVIGIAIAVLIALGGMRMMSLRSYGLALAASIIAMVPCLSPCCCLGLPAGIWALVVLNDANVKASFRP